MSMRHKAYYIFIYYIYHIPLLEQQCRCCYITTTVIAVCVGRFPTNRSNGAAIELLLFWLCCGCVRKPHQPLRKRKKKKTRLMVCHNSGSGSLCDWSDSDWSFVRVAQNKNNVLLFRMFHSEQFSGNHFCLWCFDQYRPLTLGVCDFLMIS